jgi:hypothetical protein
MIDGRRFPVTAAHVLDKRKYGQLSVGGESVLVPLEGKCMESLAPNNDRDQDHFDIAVIGVGEQFAARLGEVTYIGPESVSSNRRNAEKRVLYLCVGYPNSKNKDLHATQREMSAEFWNHIAPGHLTHDGIGEWAKTTSDHLFIDVPKKHAVNVHGQKINAVHPKGASGGPVFYIGDFADYDNYSADKECRPMLEAIIIERKVEARTLITVQIRAVIKAAKSAGILWSD